MRINFLFNAVFDPVEVGSSFLQHDHSVPVLLSDLQIGNYLTYELADAGVTGGVVELTWTDKLVIRVGFWFPGQPSESILSNLEGYAIGQMDDGIGEGGFELRADEQGEELSVFADTASRPEVEVVNDGLEVKEPSIVAIAARVGDQAKIRDAILACEPLDDLHLGFSPLDYAIQNGHAEIAMMLLDGGANANQTSLMGTTPLMGCALSHHLTAQESLAVARKLLECGADVNAKNESGHSAASLAENRKKADLIQLFSGMAN